VQSTATNVGDYLAEVPASRRAALTKLRKLCVNTLTGFVEGIEYGLPCYKKNGAVQVAFASQKNYIALYILKKEVVDAFRAELVGAKIGKGCIRFAKPEQLDFKLVKKLLVAARASKEPAC